MAKKNTMEENIRNYGEEIVSLESFVEAVRKLPGMYIGSKGNRGFVTMIKEIFQNSVDELMRKSSPCTRIRISYDERTHTTIIEDDGRGIPFNSIIKIFTSQHTSSNYNKKDGEYTSGVHGVGSKVTNALSSTFIVETYVLGEARRVEFIDGIPSSKGIETIPNPGKQGTIVMFRPSYEIMGDLTVTVQDVLNLVQLILPLTSTGAIVDFKGIFIDGKEYNQTMVNEDGIIADLIMKTTNPLIKPIIYSQDTGTMKADIAFTYDSDNLEIENITSYANFCPVRDGAFLEGFTEGLCTFFRVYMNKVYLANNKKLSVINNDIKTGLKGIVTVSHINPVFTGQAKEILSNEDMYPFVRTLTANTLGQWSKSNPQDLQKLCKYFKEIAEIRVKSDEGKVKLSTKYESSVLSGLPKKYIPPTGKHNLELLIVEGDSAAGSARNSRCNKRQGLFPIRGKLPNALLTQKAKFLSNSEVASIITIVGGGYGRSFDISKVKWEKIIFMADADKDGLHIRSLLLKFFLVYMPDMIEQGRVFSAIPPLYGVQKKKEYIYFTDRLDYVLYCQKIFSKNNSISTLRGNTLTGKEITEILYRNIDYTYEFEIISNRYAVDPCLLELVIVNINKSIDELGSIISDKYRFVSVHKKNSTIVIEGLLGSHYQTLFINDQFLSDIVDLIKYIDYNTNMYYIVNNDIKSLYEIMKLYESSTPSGITRFKGLGEMNAGQLAESTMHPDSQYRSLLRYTIESVKEELETLRYLDSNKHELIKDAEVSRMDLK